MHSLAEKKIENEFDGLIQYLQYKGQIYYFDIDAEDLDKSILEEISFQEETRIYAAKYRKHIFKIEKKNYLISLIPMF